MVIRKTRTSIKKVTEDKKPLSELVKIDEKISLDVVEVNNHYEKTKAAFSRIYYISEGIMQLIINNQELLLEKGDACFVEKGMLFELKGTFTVIIVSRPTLYL